MPASQRSVRLWQNPPQGPTRSQQFNNRHSQPRSFAGRPLRNLNKSGLLFDPFREENCLSRVILRRTSLGADRTARPLRNPKSPSGVIGKNWAIPAHLLILIGNLSYRPIVAFSRLLPTP